MWSNVGDWGYNWWVFLRFGNPAKLKPRSLTAEMDSIRNGKPGEVVAAVADRGNGFYPERETRQNCSRGR